MTASEVLLGAGGNSPPPPPPPPPAPQTVAMKLLQVVKSPSLPTARQVIYKVKDTGHTVVGNPMIAGATLNCASTAGGTVLANNAKSFKVNDAPAPAGCGVTACSPSGAFIDDNTILGSTPE